MSAEPILFSKSIGTKASYSTGTITFDYTGLIVTLSSGSFDENWGCGDVLIIGEGEILYVLSRDSTTQLTLQFASSNVEETDLEYNLRRYSSTIAVWEAETRQDLITNNNIEIGVCYNDSQYVEDVIISGATTDEYCFRMLTVAEGHRHLGNVLSGASLNGTITIHDSYTHIEHLRFTHPVADSSGDYIIDCPSSNTAKYITITSVLMHDYHCVGDYGKLYGIRISSNGGCRILNTIITNFYKDNTEADNGSMAGIYIGPSTDTTPNYIYNCTVLNLYTNALYMKADGGIGVYDNKTIVKNCIGMVRQYTSDHSAAQNVEIGNLHEVPNYKYDFTNTVNKQSGYNAQQGGGYYLSHYMPDLWQEKGTEQLWNRISCSQTGQQVIATCYNSNVYYSNDFGDTWEAVSVSATAGIATGNFYSSSISRGMTFVNEISAHTIVATSVGGIFASNDGGSNWFVSSGTGGLPITATHYNSCISDNGRVALVRSNDAPLKISTDYCSTFIDLSATWTGFSTSSGTTYITSLPNIPLARKWRNIEVSDNGEFILATVGGQAIVSGAYEPYAYSYPLSKGGRFWVGVSGVGGYTFTEIVSADNEPLIAISDFQGCDVSRTGQYMIVSCSTGNAYGGGSIYNPTTNGTHAISQIYMSSDYGQSWTNLHLNSRTLDVLESISGVSISGTSGTEGYPSVPIAGSPSIRVRTATPHRLREDDVIIISGHQGTNSNCNGTFKVTPIDEHVLELYTTYRDWRNTVPPNGVSGFGGTLTTQGKWYGVTISDDGKTMLATYGNDGTTFSSNIKGYIWQSDDYGETWYNNHDYTSKIDYQDINISENGEYSFLTKCDIWGEVPDFIGVRNKRDNIWSNVEDVFVNAGPNSDVGNAFVGYGYHAKDINFDGVYEKGYGYHYKQKQIYKTQVGESGNITFDYLTISRMVAGYQYIDANTFGMLTELKPITEVSGGTTFSSDDPSNVFYGTFSFNNVTNRLVLLSGDSGLEDVIEMVHGIIQFKEDYIFDWTNNPILPSGGGYVQDGVYPQLISASSTQTGLIAGPAVLCVGQKHNISFKYIITDRVYTADFDLRIKNSSSVISAGTIIEGIWELLIDITGNPRSDTIPWDIGAYKWVYIPTPDLNNIIAKIQYYRNITIS